MFQRQGGQVHKLLALDELKVHKADKLIGSQAVSSNSKFSIQNL